MLNNMVSFYVKVKHLLLLEPGNGLVNCDKKRTANAASKENHRAKGQRQLEHIGLGVGQFINRIEQHKETKDGPNNEGGDKDGGHVGYYYGRFYRNVKHLLLAETKPHQQKKRAGDGTVVQNRLAHTHVQVFLAGVGGKRQNQGADAKQGPSSDQTKDSIDHMPVE